MSAKGHFRDTVSTKEETAQERKAREQRAAEIQRRMALAEKQKQKKSGK